MRKYVGVLKTVMQRDHAAVRRAVGTDGPIVLSDREFIERDHGLTGRHRPGLDALDQSADLVEFLAQMVVHGDQVRATARPIRCTSHPLAMPSSSPLGLVPQLRFAKADSRVERPGRRQVVRTGNRKYLTDSSP